MKKALLIGINKYQLPGNNLNGCINDVQVIRDLLIKSYGFDQSNITILTDNDATGNNIINALNHLTSSGPSDSLVFHYSGHGTRIPDSSKPDGQDDAICPCDARNVSSCISGGLLRSCISNLPLGAKLYFISDSCHSGSVDRSFLTDQIVPRFMALPGSVNNQTGNTTRLIQGEHLLLAGCKDDQTSADAWFGNTPHGALTYSILNALFKTPNCQWTQLGNLCQLWMKQNGFVQVPQLSGPVDLLSEAVFT